MVKMRLGAVPESRYSQIPAARLQSSQRGARMGTVLVEAKLLV
ncbi:MAG: hypothetical protein WCQ65_12910 [Fermentimonas sp.]